MSSRWTEQQAPVPAQKQSWFQRLSLGLRRSSDPLPTSGIAGVFTKKKLDQAMLDELEDILIQGDFGLDTAENVIEMLRRGDRFDRDISPDEVRDVLATEIEKALTPVAQPLHLDPAKRPFVVLMVGVNGTGKTTTIGKLSALLHAQGKKVMLAAGDTFRAAAIEQLQVWGDRTSAAVVTQPAGSDAASLAFEAVTRASRTASMRSSSIPRGGFNNRDELMSELENHPGDQEGGRDGAACHVADARCHHRPECP